MSDNHLQVDVAIIGAGPAGLAAATELRKRGIKSIIILERESEAGGIPRHCGHPPFGMREFYRVLTGPKYAARLVEQATNAGAKILTRHSVTCILPHGELEVATPNGMINIAAKRVLIATGVREKPRSARLVTGTRPQGITTTGALQSMIYLKGLIPFKRPVIVGTELVSFSAIMTAFKGGIKPVAMIEKNNRITARHPCELIASFKHVPIYFNTELETIVGTSKVEGVNVTHNGESRMIDCDGVIFTGNFTPEVSLARLSHLKIDPASGGLEIDQFARCSDPAYFAAGNILRPVETAGWSYREGRTVGALIADDLENNLPTNEPEIFCKCEAPIKLVVPQRIIPGQSGGFNKLQLRVTRAVKGKMIIEDDHGIIWQKNMSVIPERRILIPLSSLDLKEGTKILKFYFKE
ncbi:MAG: FAD-dependent oxidoreductase [Emcibacteraceae bacterium]|nr:FAD-dependent oxidoreductase [Emcibacteraceae bacterium]